MNYPGSRGKGTSKKIVSLLFRCRKTLDHVGARKGAYNMEGKKIILLNGGG